MHNFNKIFLVAQGAKSAPICGHCEGRGVTPKDCKVVTCPKCNGTGKEKQ